jgi:hypothetical protein
VSATTNLYDNEYKEKIDKEIENARDKAEREKRQAELDAKAQEEVREEAEIARQEAENQAMLDKINQKKVSGEYLSYKDALMKYEKGQVVSAVGKFDQQVNLKESIIMTHVEMTYDYDIMQGEWVFNKVIDQPIKVQNDTIFAMEKDSLELQLEFIKVIERMSVSGLKIIPMFKLLECVVIQEATEEQVFRMKSQN